MYYKFTDATPGHITVSMMTFDGEKESGDIRLTYLTSDDSFTKVRELSLDRAGGRPGLDVLPLRLL